MLGGLDPGKNRWVAQQTPTHIDEDFNICDALGVSAGSGLRSRDLQIMSLAPWPSF